MVFLRIRLNVQDLRRISMDFKAFWTGPSVVGVHLPMHFIDCLDFIDFP